MIAQVPPIPPPLQQLHKQTKNRVEARFFFLHLLGKVIAAIKGIFYRIKK